MSSISAIHESQCCISAIGDGLSRMLPSPFGTSRSNADVSRSYNSVTRINSPGQRFTATHGISAKVSTVWKFQNFTFTQILREINFDHLGSNF